MEKDKQRITLTERLKAVRIIRGMSERDLAAKAKVPLRIVRAYEKRGVNPSCDLSLLVYIAEALDVTTDYLLGVTEFTWSGAERDSDGQ